MPTNRAMGWAMGASALVHLSAVTVFSIVLYFPKHDIEYVSFQIRPERPTIALPDAKKLTLSKLENPFEEDAEGGFGAEGATESSETAVIPDIQLPSVRFDELQALELAEQSLRLGRNYDDLFGARPRDAWARIGEGVGRLRDVLSGLPGLPRHSESEEAQAPILVSRHANGFSIYVRWSTPPYARGVLWAQPIEALHETQPTDLAQPLALSFQVNPEGRVVFVPTPVDADDVLTESTAFALLEYRFEPITSQGAEIQLGTLLIRPEADGA
jgi:hypothetical protein